jgi:negative regulator of sigma E activity
MRLVVDEETGLLLEIEKLDYQGARTMVSRFTTVILDPELPQPPERKSSSWRRRWEKYGAQKRERPELSFAPLAPRFLPEGFREKKTCRYSVRERGKEGRVAVVRTMYSDGMSWIDIRQSPAAPGSEENKVRQYRRGSRVKMYVVIGGVEVRLVGRLDPAELLEVLDSLAVAPKGEG